jgi:hypothetical protein
LVVSQFEIRSPFVGSESSAITGHMPKRPRDPNQFANLIVDIAIGDVEDAVSEQKKDVSLNGRKGDLKSGSLSSSKDSIMRGGWPRLNHRSCR